MSRLSGEMTRTVLILQFVVIFCIASLTYSKTFATCELFKELLKQGFPHNQLNDWLCLIEAESSRRTDVIGGPDEDGSHDYGLFQINDRYWCSTGAIPGESCSLRCKDLLTDDITKASTCAKKIYGVHGFYAWVGWVNKCKGKHLSYMNCRD